MNELDFRDTYNDRREIDVEICVMLFKNFMSLALLMRWHYSIFRNEKTKVQRVRVF